MQILISVLEAISNINNELNSRELSILLWIILISALFIYKDDSNTIRNLGKVIFTKPILTIIALFLVYVLLESAFLKRLGIWTKSSFKDLFWWILFTGIFTIGDFQKLKDENSYFKDSIKSFFKFTFLIETLIQLNTFSFAFEFLLIIPITSFALFSLSYLQFYEVENKRLLENFFAGLFFLIGVTLLFHSISVFIQKKDELDYLEQVLEIIFPICLSFLFVPFVYLLWYYSRIENLMSINKSFFIHPKPSFILLLKVTFILKFNLKNIERWKDQALRFGLRNSKDLILEARKIKSIIQSEKFRVSVPLEKGWSIKDASEFLLGFDLIVGDYKEDIQNGLEWFACSKYRNLDGGILQNNIAFYLSGNEFIVSELKIITNFYTKYNKDEPSMTIFLEASQILFRKAFIMNMEKALLEKLKNSIPFKIVILDKIVSFKKDIWSTSLGYHLTFCIENNL